MLVPGALGNLAIHSDQLCGSLVSAKAIHRCVGVNSSSMASLSTCCLELVILDGHFVQPC